MQLKTTSQPLFLELNIPTKLNIDLSTKFYTATAANFERNMGIEKATTTAATSWLRCIIQPQCILHFYKSFLQKSV